MSIAALTWSAHAQVTLYSTSWEAPTFTTGSPAPPNDGWENGSGSGASQTVTNERARTGSQSLKWDNSGTNNSFYSIRRAFTWSSSDPDKLVVSTYVRVSSSTEANRLYGLYLTGSATGTLGSTILGITIGGDGTVRAGTSWSATYGASGVIGQASPGTYTDRWLYMELTLDRGSGAATAKVSGFADGSQFTASFTQSTTPANVNIGTDYVTTSNRAGVGYFDDLEIKAVAGTPFEGWDEQRDGGGDAGDLPETAQSTGSGPLNAIRGTIGAANDVDIYAIYISDPSTFSATTVGGTTLDTALWLFDENGKGVVFNEDDADGTSFQSRIDNRSNCITQPGLYYLAISLFGRRAAGCNDGQIWQTTPYRSVRCPDGAEPTSRLAGWSGSTSSTGTYRIFLTGVSGATAGDPADCPPFEGWDETANGGGDAGDLPATAQLITSSDATPCETPVQRVRGELEADGVDMYLICITDPNSFVATTVGGTSIDTQLWLFNCDGTGVAFNDDSTGLQSTIDLSALSSNCQLPPAGTYLLAVSRYNRDAIDASGQLLWNNTPFSGVRCPDGPGASNPVAGWTGTTSAGGTYVIQLQGAYFVSTSGCETPPPGCEGDATGDGRVDDADLLAVLFAFGNTCFGCPEDVNGDNFVDDADLLIVLFNFGCGS
jgi:hypothetical protein